MKGKKSKVSFFSYHKGTVHTKEKIKAKKSFDNRVFMHFLWYVFVVFPSVFQGLDIKFWSTYKVTSFSAMPFQYCKCIVKRKAHCHGVKSEKGLSIIKEFNYATAILSSIQFPIAIEENQCAYNEKGRNFEKPCQMTPFIFNIKHGNTQEANNQYI